MWLWGIRVEDLTSELTCYYTHNAYKFEIYLYVMIVRRDISVTETTMELNKNQNVANEQMKTTIIVLQTLLSRLLITVSQCIVQYAYTFIDH